MNDSAMAASALHNADLAPTTAAQRNWTWYHYAALWVGMVMCIPSYTLAAGLIDQGMSPWQAVGTVLLGNLIVLAPMLIAPLIISWSSGPSRSSLFRTPEEMAYLRRRTPLLLLRDVVARRRFSK